MAGPEQAARQGGDVLHPRKRVGICPVRAAVVGVAVTATLGYFVLYSKKKPEASAGDVAKVVTGFSSPENTHPRK